MVKKILIIALNEKWVGISRLPSGLDRAGFSVYALCPQKSYLAKTRFLKKSIFYPTFTYSRSKIIYLWIIFAFVFLNPDFVIPGDEDAILALQRLSNGLAAIPFLKKISGIIRLSLPSKDYDELMLSKSNFQKKCVEWGIRTPENIVIENIQSALLASYLLSYPVVLKYDMGYGSSGVHICQSEFELIEKMRYFKMTSLSKKIKNFLKELLFVSIFSGKNIISLQQYIQGVHGQVPFCSNKGKVFAHNIMSSLKIHPTETGATTVSRGIENQELDCYLTSFVKKTNYTGFGSLEFIMEEKTGLPYVIELNPRPTPTCHISNQIITNDLCEYLFKGLNFIKSETAIFKDYTLAMFPGEQKRDPHSTFLTNAYHDIPNNDLALLQMLEEINIG